MKTKFVFYLVLIIFCCASFAFAQETKISPKKKALIAEIIKAMKADETMKETMQAVFKQMDENYPLFVKATLEGKTGVTAAQKNQIAEALIKQREKTNTFQSRLVEAINFQEFIEQTFYPLYDKFFTEVELKDLLAFYKSPTGQKLNAVTPLIAADSIKASQEIFLPKMMTIINRIINEDIEKQTKSAPQVKPKNSSK